MLSIEMAEYLRKQANIDVVDLDWLASGLHRNIFPDSLRVRPIKTELQALFSQALAGKNLLLDGGANVGVGLADYFGGISADLRSNIETIPFSIICTVTADPKAQASPGFYHKLFPWAKIILAYPKATFGEYQTSPCLPPTGFESCKCFSVPPAPAAVIGAYLTHKRSITSLAQSSDPQFAEIQPFAAEYLSIIRQEFDKIVPLILNHDENHNRIS